MNTNTETLADVTTDVELTIGSSSPKTTYKKESVTTYFATVWSKSFWIGDAPEQKINIDHNVEYLSATKFIPNFDPELKSSFTEQSITRKYDDWQKQPRDLYENGFWQRGMGAAGARADIGVHPGWMMQWLYTGDWRHREIALRQADLAGAWRVQFTEGDAARKYDRAQTVSALGRPLSMFARPHERLFDRNQTSSKNEIIIHSTVGSNRWAFQAAHEPDPFSLPYMLTGDWWYLYELQMWAGADALMEAINESADRTPAYASTLRVASPVIAGFSNEVRGMAWALRNRARAGFHSPDGSPEQAYFNDITDDMIAVWEGQRDISDSSLKNTPAWKYGNTKVRLDPSPLHVFEPIDVEITGRGNARGWVNGRTDTMAPWQQHYLIIVLGSLRDMGYPTGSLLRWTGKLLTEPFKEVPPNGTFDPRLIQAYHVPVRAGGAGPFFTSWQQVQAEFTPKEFGNRTQQFDTLRGNFGILAYAASAMIANESGGKIVWDFLKANIHDKPVAVRRFYLNEPGWDILPRTTDNMPLPPPVMTPVDSNLLPASGR
jgi:hypothetical protein